MKILLITSVDLCCTFNNYCDIIIMMKTVIMLQIIISAYKYLQELDLKDLSLV